MDDDEPRRELADEIAAAAEREQIEADLTAETAPGPDVIFRLVDVDHERVLAGQRAQQGARVRV